MKSTAKIFFALTVLALACSFPYQKTTEQIDTCPATAKYESNLLHSEVWRQSQCEDKSSKRNVYWCLAEQIIKHGGEINKLEMREIWPGNNGLVAKEDIKMGEVLMYIPPQMLISWENAQQSEIV